MSDPAKANILLVDDEPGKLMSHEVILTQLGENIVKVNSGLKALEFLLKNDCAVIVLDVNMPVMDGFETAALIRQRPSLERTPIIFVSAYNVSDFDRLKGYGIGAVDYLFIPVIPDVLRAKVQVFVELFKQKQIITNQAVFLAQQNREKEEQIRTIRELNERLNIANEELEAFSYTVSHDLRGPVRAMHGFSEILLADYQSHLPPEGVSHLNRILKAATRMDALIRDILAYARATKIELSMEPINLDALLESILESHESLQQPRAHVAVERPLHGVVGNEASLSQCLSNLLLNAVKFVPQGKTPEVRVRTDPSDAGVRIWIEDNGIGIDPAHFERIFQMFGRIHDTTTYDGNGIGLAIVKRGVQRMGGKVGVESQVGQGSKFWIELPGGEPRSVQA
ncbi:MAG: ATP-binding protein [Verrucomicrobiota bacterium]